ncbi:hypothetical protein E8E11_007470 [Didymella keratinophila]|nr:hypothetical protein E8E11_007470 [Didymella keratinophila]
MVFTISPHSWVQRNRAQYNMSTNSADAYTPSQFQSRLQSAHSYSSTSLTRATQPTTKVEFLQGGTIHTFNLPIACSPREIESLQEFAMNTRFGTTNLTPRRGAYITSVGNRLKAACPELCAELERAEKSRTSLAESEKIRGGIFDGLSKQEAQWLREMGWDEWTQQSGAENKDPSSERTEPSHYLEELDARFGIAER